MNRFLKFLFSKLKMLFNLQQTFSKDGNTYSLSFLNGRTVGLLLDKIGIIYNDLEEYEKVLADFNKAIRLNPQIAKDYNERGIILYNIGKNENNIEISLQALSDFTKAIQINPDFTEAYYNVKHGEVFICMLILRSHFILFQIRFQRFPPRRNRDCLPNPLHKSYLVREQHLHRQHVHPRQDRFP